MQAAAGRSAAAALFAPAHEGRGKGLCGCRLGVLVVLEAPLGLLRALELQGSLPLQHVPHVFLFADVHLRARGAGESGTGRADKGRGGE